MTHDHTRALQPEHARIRTRVAAPDGFIPYVYAADEPADGDTIGDGIVFPPGDLDHPPLETVDGLDMPDRPR